MNVAEGLVVYPKVIHQRIMYELPFMATENIMMDAVKKGGDRQQLHELIRRHSLEAAKVVKEEGKPNDLIDRIAGDENFGLTREEIEKTLQPENFTGRAGRQTEEFLDEYVKPVIEANKDVLGDGVELTV